MGPMVPAGRESALAWRALSPQQRADAWAAAKIGAAPSDATVAAVMVGYGLRWQRRLMFAPMAILAGFLALVCAGTVLLVNVDDPPDLPVAVLEPVIFLLIIGPVVASAVYRIRFRRLAAAGVLGLEAVGQGALPAGAPVSLAGESTFTIPYGVPAAYSGYGVPAVGTVHLGHSAAPAPSPTGVVELRSRRAPVIIAVVVFSALIVLLGSLVGVQVFALSLTSDTAELWLPVAVETLAVLALIGSLAVLLILLWPVVRNPVTTRFTPQGWELPASGLRGEWGDVLAIEVRAFSVGSGGRYGQRALPTTRLVVLRVNAPEGYLAGLGPVRRWALGRNLRRYGSPVILTAGPRTPIGLEPLLATLAQFTGAPVRWT